jgi:hypothetical protein
MLRRFVEWSRGVYSPLRTRHESYVRYDQMLGAGVSWEYHVIPDVLVL